MVSFICCHNSLYNFFFSGSAQAEPEEETETSNKGVMEKALQKTEIQNIEEHQDSSVTATPLRLSRFEMLIVCVFQLLIIVTFT